MGQMMRKKIVRNRWVDEIGKGGFRGQHEFLQSELIKFL